MGTQVGGGVATRLGRPVACETRYNNKTLNGSPGRNDLIYFSSRNSIDTLVQPP